MDVPHTRVLQSKKCVSFFLFLSFLCFSKYRVYRLSRTLSKELDPLVGSKIVIIITIFAFSQRNCRVLGVHEERKEEEGKGEGGRRMEEERAGHVFLTFRMVIGEQPSERIRDDLGLPFVLIMVKFRS